VHLQPVGGIGPDKWRPYNPHSSARLLSDSSFTPMWSGYRPVTARGERANWMHAPRKLGANHLQSAPKSAFPYT